MAFTKMGKAIKKGLKNSIKYIINPEKTDNYNYVSTFGVSHIETATDDFKEIIDLNKSKRLKNHARHLIQSFLPGETTPDIVHEIGKKLCEQYLLGEYQYVLATHIDQGHIHNHIIWNNVSMIDYKCYDVTQDDIEIRKISDNLCIQYGLSVIDVDREEKRHLSETRKNTRSYYENMCRNKGISWKAKIQYAIDLCIEQSTNYSEFIEYLKALNLDVEDTGKYLKIKHITQTKFTRCSEKNFGKDYTRYKIKERINKNNDYKHIYNNIVLLDKNHNITKKEFESALDELLEKSESYEDYLENFKLKGYEYDYTNIVIKHHSNDKIKEIPIDKLHQRYNPKNIRKKYEYSKIKTKQRTIIKYYDHKKINGLKYAIDNAIKKTDNIDEFLAQMEVYGYKYKIDVENNISFKPENYNQYIDCRREIMGNMYEYQEIIFRLDNKSHFLEYEDIKSISRKNDTSDEDIYKSIRTVTNDLLILNKYGIESFSEINRIMISENFKLKSNIELIDNYKDEIKSIRLNKYSSSGSDSRILDLTIKINDLYNDNISIKKRLKNLEKIQKNASKFMNCEYKELEKLLYKVNHSFHQVLI